MFPLSSSQLNVNWAELAKLSYEVEEELEYQARIVKARDYYAGQFSEDLHEELEKALVGQDLDEAFTAMNLYRTIVDSVTDRLSISGVQVKGDENIDRVVGEWWKNNKMAAEQDTLHTFVVRDAEAFVIIEANEDDTAEGGISIDWHIHERYTDPEVEGDGQGCRAHYDGKKLVFVSKRWIETVYDDDGSPDTRQRMTLYFADRVEKYVLNDDGVWEEYQDEEDGGWPIAWGSETEPIGISAVHFRLRELRPYAQDGLGLQVLSDHNISSIAAASQMSGFPFLFVSGTWPTNDGQPPDSENSNVWHLGARSVIGSESKDAKAQRIPSGNMGELLSTQDKLLLYTAATTRTPTFATMMLRGANVSGATLQQLDMAQLTKARRLIQDFTPGYELLIKQSIDIFNAFASGKLEVPEGKQLGVSAIWESPEFQGRDIINQEIQRKQETGVPAEQLWAEFGYGPDEISSMKRNRSRELVIELLSGAAQMGNTIAAQALSAVFMAQQVADKTAEDAAWTQAIEAVSSLGSHTLNSVGEAQAAVGEANNNEQQQNQQEPQRLPSGVGDGVTITQGKNVGGGE